MLYFKHISDPVYHLLDLGDVLNLQSFLNLEVCTPNPKPMSGLGRRTTEMLANFIKERLALGGGMLFAVVKCGGQSSVQRSDCLS